MKTDLKQKQFLIVKEKIIGLLKKYPLGLYVEKLKGAYTTMYGEELLPWTVGFQCLGKMLQCMGDVVDIKWKKPEETKWILCMKSTKEKGEIMVILGKNNWR